MKGESDDEEEQENKENDGKDDGTGNEVNINRVREIPHLYYCLQGNDYELKEKKYDEGEDESKENDEKGDDDEDEVKDNDEKGDDDEFQENDFENDNVEKEGRRGEKWDTLRLAGSKPQSSLKSADPFKSLAS